MDIRIPVQERLFLKSFFSVTACITNTTTICNRPSGCKTGDLIADPEDCKKYFQCTNEEWISKDVAPGTAFNYKDCQIVHEAVVTCFNDDEGCGSTTSISTTTFGGICRP